MNRDSIKARINDRFIMFSEIWKSAFSRECDGNTDNYPVPPICSSGKAFSIMQFQIKADLEYCSDEQSPFLRLRDTPDSPVKRVNDQFTAFFEKAKRVSPALVLTPEYSVPKERVLGLLSKPDELPDGTLFVLCCEGLVIEDLIKLIGEVESISADIHVCKDALAHECREPHGITSCIFYIIKSTWRNTSKIIVIPQLKTLHMRDVHLLFEGRLLCAGTKVIIFDGNKLNHRDFMSLICADVINLELLEDIKVYIMAMRESKPLRKLLFFNPQLNANPRHGYFRLMQSLFVEQQENSSTDHTLSRILTLNWAEGSRIYSYDHNKTCEKPSIIINLPYSALFEKHSETMLKRKRETLQNLARWGLEYVYSDSLGIWLFFPYEHFFYYVLADQAEEDSIAALKPYRFCGSDISLEMETGSYCDRIMSLHLRRKEFSRLLECKSGDCTHDCSRCGKDVIDDVVSSLYYHKRPYTDEFIKCDSSDVFRLYGHDMFKVTSKQFKGEKSRENLYTLLRMARLIPICEAEARGIDVTNEDPKIAAQFINGHDQEFNVMLTLGSCLKAIKCIYLKNSGNKVAKMLYDQLAKSKTFGMASNISIYFDDIDGIKRYTPAQVYTCSIRRRDATFSNVSMDRPNARKDFLS